MKVSTKGQVTIPHELREKTGIQPGSEVQFREEHGRLYLQKMTDSGRGGKIVAAMTGRGNLRLSTDEIMKLTRGRR